MREILYKKIILKEGKRWPSTKEYLCNILCFAFKQALYYMGHIVFQEHKTITPKNGHYDAKSVANKLYMFVLMD